MTTNHVKLITPSFDMGVRKRSPKGDHRKKKVPLDYKLLAAFNRLINDEEVNNIEGRLKQCIADVYFENPKLDKTKFLRKYGKSLLQNVITIRSIKILEFVHDNFRECGDNWNSIFNHILEEYVKELSQNKNLIQEDREFIVSLQEIFGDALYDLANKFDIKSDLEGSRVSPKRQRP